LGWSSIDHSNEYRATAQLRTAWFHEHGEDELDLCRGARPLAMAAPKHLLLPHFQ
jgi:hypothetical protein